jgi:ribosomal protein L22
MSAEEEQGDVVPEETPEAKRPAAKRPRVKKPAKAQGAEAQAAAKDAEAKAGDDAKGAEGPKAAAKKAPAEKVSAEKAPAEKAPAEEAEPAVQESVAAEERRASRPAPRTQAPRRRVVRARARYVRTSARKARMVCVHLRGKTVPEARAILAFTSREAARDWSKLLESAVANAENNHELLEQDLVVREAYADEGPTIKRFRPRAMGRATPIHKRTSHLTITLTPGA